VVRLLLEMGADSQAKTEVSAIPAVHLGYVAFLPTNLLYPCLTALSVCGCSLEKRR
jgi:hypothetical protein